jgi:opacity protein-like surface antigen
MRILLALIGTSILASVSATEAPAADLGRGPPVYSAPIAPAPAPLNTSGFYLRGSVGWSNVDSDGGTILGGGLPLTSPLNGFTEASTKRGTASNSFTLGVGAGYRFNSNFRADVTLDYRAPRNLGISFAGTLPPEVINGSILTKSRYTLGLANAYFDIVTICGEANLCVTPYVGAGIGFANIRQTNYFEVQNGTTATFTDTARAADKTNFAWALMAGVSLDLTRQWSVDLGYRFVALGDGPVFTPTVGALAANQTVRFDKLQEHGVKLSVRYAFQ